MSSTTKHNDYIPGHKPKHIASHAWRTAENSCAYLLPTLKEHVKKNPQLKALDCGCGPGTITASLAKYLPEGHIIATDLSSDVVAQAQAHAREIGATNMSAQTASIYELPFGENEFDLVHAQQVLFHLDQPLQALKEMLRVCKPGGIVAVRESDLRMMNVWPETEGLLSTARVLQAVMKASGGSTNLGVRLLSLALEAGAKRKDVEYTMGTWCWSTRDDREAWGGTMAVRLREGNMRRVVAEKKLGWTMEELDAMADEWDKWVDIEDACYGSMHGEVIVTKR